MTDQHDPAETPGADERPLRPWWTCETAEAWFHDAHGRAPVDQYLGLRRRMEATGCTFRQAYLALLDSGAIIPIDKALAGYPPDGIDVGIGDEL